MQPLRVKLLAVAMVIFVIGLTIAEHTVLPEQPGESGSIPLLFAAMIVTASLSLLFHPHRLAWWFLVVILSSGFLFSILALLLRVLSDGPARLAELPYLLGWLITLVVAAFIFLVPLLILLSHRPAQWAERESDSQEGTITEDAEGTG